MKIYTKGGDTGDTSLLKGIRKSKTDEVFELLGTLDELSSVMGVGLAFASFTTEAREVLYSIQRDLLKIGSIVANPKADKDSFEWLESKTQSLEEYIDELDSQLPELRNFILPGGSKGASLMHHSRSVARRLERIANLYFRNKDAVDTTFLLKYLNRLSDFLFVLARYVNKSESVEETKWKNE